MALVLYPHVKEPHFRVAECCGRCNAAVPHFPRIRVVTRSHYGVLVRLDSATITDAVALSPDIQLPSVFCVSGFVGACGREKISRPNHQRQQEDATLDVGRACGVPSHSRTPHVCCSLRRGHEPRSSIYTHPAARACPLNLQVAEASVAIIADQSFVWLKCVHVYVASHHREPA